MGRKSGTPGESGRSHRDGGTGRPERREGRIRYYEEKTRQFLDQSFNPVWVNIGGKIAYANPGCASLLGAKTPADLVGRSVFDIIHPDYHEKVRERIRIMIEEDRGVPVIPEKVVRLDGTVVDVEITAMKFPFEGKEAILVLLRDITEYRVAEGALRESEEKFRVLAETSPALIIVHRGGPLLYANNMALAFTGYARDELVGMHFLQLIHPDDLERIRSRAYARLGGETVPASYEMKLVTKEGKIKWVFLAAGRIVYQGKPAILATLFDITERKQAEMALLEKKEDLALSQRIANLGSWHYDAATSREEWSDEFYRIMGIEPGSVRPDYQRFMSLVHPDDRELVARESRDALEQNRPSSYDFRIIRPDGATRYVHIECPRTVRDARGLPLGVLGTIQDITERKRVENELNEAKASAELYLDLMGHDITNMNQIGMGYLEFALDALPLDDPGRELVGRSLAAFESSSRLIQNVRKLQKIRGGDLPAQKMDLGQVLAAVVGRYADKCPIRYRRIAGAFVMADELLYDLFASLVDNAVKHSRESPDIGLIVDEVAEDGRRFYRVAIEDHGPGIPDSLKTIIFNRTLRGTDKAKGSGLGLYVVNMLVEKYHGRVWVEDRVEGDRSRGSRFVVLLPAAD